MPDYEIVPGVTISYKWTRGQVIRVTASRLVTILWEPTDRLRGYLGAQGTWAVDQTPGAGPLDLLPSGQVPHEVVSR